MKKRQSLDKKNTFINSHSIRAVAITFVFLLMLVVFSVPVSAANPQIKVTTNRMVILDDPNSGYLGVSPNAQTGEGFGLPGSWSSDMWNGESTTIRGVALVLNESGMPQSGITVTFYVKDWDDAVPRSPLKRGGLNPKTTTTNSNGLATMAFDLNDEQQYGYWTVTATATVNSQDVSGSSVFVYNWWGCQNCHGRPYSDWGEDKGYPGRATAASRYDPVSPYITGRDWHARIYDSNHGTGGGDVSEGECWSCHNSYDQDLHTGQVRRSEGSSYTGKGVPSTYGVHSGKICADCHATLAASDPGTQTIKSCDASGCHVQATGQQNLKLTQIPVVTMGANDYSSYSALDVVLGMRTFSGDFPTLATFSSNAIEGAKSHTSASSQEVPCTICHGPMHNVTKPVPSGTSNTYTEESQCLYCHEDKKHSTSPQVECTACHSQDAHKVRVLSSAATGDSGDYPSNADQYGRADYVLRDDSNALTYTSADCVMCHNSSSSVSTFFNNLDTLDSTAYSNGYTPQTDWMSKDIAYHNGSVGNATGVGCTVCHQSDNVTQYHSIPFMQTDASFTTINATAVDCADCHINGDVANTYVEGLGETPPEVNRKHNGNIDCQFCHDRSPHGKPKFIDISASLADGTIAAGDYTETKANSIGMTNCTACHINASATLNTYFGTSETITQQDRFGHEIAFHNGTAGGSTGVTCDVCHSDMHMAGYLNSSAQYQTSNVSAVGCADCHIAGTTVNTYVNTTFGLIIPEVVKGHNGDIDCRLCHEESPHGKPHYLNNSADLSDGVIEESDYTTNYSEAMTGCTVCHVNGNETITTFQGVTVTVPKTDFYNYTITNHNNSADFDCDICHNNIHDVGYLNNSAGFDSTFNTSTVVDCNQCHTDGTAVNNYADAQGLNMPIREFHNNAVDCSACHDHSPHGIRLRAINGSFVDGYSLFIDEVNKVTCTACHYANGPVNATTLGVERFPKFFSDNLRHSTNASSGKLWNASTYWNNDIEACGYCHGLAMHATNALGNITQIYNGDNVIGAYLDNETTHWCAMCHVSSYPGYNGTKFSPIPPTIIVNNTGNATTWVYSSREWFNHSDLAGAYEDRKCRSCHGDQIIELNSGAKITHLMHFVGPGVNGGNDCVSCHDIGGLATAQINVTVLNGSIHAGINQGSTDSTGNPDNLACIGCHSSDGIQINTHPDKKSSPWSCNSCHLETGVRNASTWVAGNVTPPIVYNHYKGSDRNNSIIHAGEDEATDRLSCVACHNLTEMKNVNYDPNNIRASEMAHYGKNRSDLRTAGVDDCAYCHQNTSTVFDVAMDVNATYHKDMPNHTTLSGGPTCTNATCHGSGLLHESTLQKPTVNTALCQVCHTDKEAHNTVVSCDKCHTDNSTTDKDIHSIKFIQSDGNYSTSNSTTTGANCTTCHQDSLITTTDLNVTRLPKVNSTLMHSNNASQGAVWNTTAGYWTDEAGSCEYCHGQTKHSAAALGNLINFNGTNTINHSLSTGTWCQSCHYQNYSSGSHTYTDMVATFVNNSVAVPPEITNHTVYGTYDINPVEYFDHQLDNYNDSTCMRCHYNGTATNITTLAHDVIIGSQSPDCTSCHTRDGRTPHSINVTAVSMGVHVNLNNNTDVGPYPAVTAACWGCHASNGTNQYGHPDKYNAAWTCADCHVENGAANTTLAGAYANATRTGSHYPGNVLEGMRTYPTDTDNSCASCHTNSLVAYTGVTYAVGYSSTSAKDANASHYSTKTDLLTTTDSTNCRHCHASGSSGYGAPVQITVGTHGFGFSTCQESCHNSAWATSGNVSLHNSSIGIYQTDASCYNGKVGCHDP